VSADVVALDHVARGRPGVPEEVGGVGDVNAVPVARDDVAGPGRRAADRVVAGADDLDAIKQVAQRGTAGDVGADVIPLDLHPRGAVVDQDGAQPAVAADDVAGAGGAAADRIAGTAGDFDARQLVPQRSGAGGIEADEVALDQVAAPEDADTAQ